MLVVPHLIICSRTAEVVLRHSVSVVVVDTAFRKDGNRQCVRIIRIRVQIRVDVADSGILRIDTGTVSIGLVGVVHNVVFLNRALIAVSSQSIQFQSLDRLPVQFSLEFQVRDADIHIVVFQLVEDVEIRPVALISLVRVERTGSIQRITVGVDVKAALHLAAHRVGLLTQCSRSFLLTVRIGSQYRETHCWGNLVRSVGVECVTAYIT